MKNSQKDLKLDDIVVPPMEPWVLAKAQERLIEYNAQDCAPILGLEPAW